MKCHRTSAIALALLFSARVVLAADNGIRIDVVVNMTDAGRKIPRPTPEKPQYYAAVWAGYTPKGADLPDQKSPPTNGDVQDMMTDALAQQGYLQAVGFKRPSIVLIFWWGYMAPQMIDTSVGAPMSATQGINESQLPGHGGSRGGGIGGMLNPDMVNALASQVHTDVTSNADEMMTLILGGAHNEDFYAQRQSPLLDQAKTMARAPRHYLMIAAYSFSDWVVLKQKTLLWRAHVSTELWGVSLEKALPQLIAQSAPLLGTETKWPQFITVPTTPNGTVIVGTPVVKDFPTTTPKSQPTPAK